MRRLAAVAAVLLALLPSGAFALGPAGTLSGEREDTGNVAVGAGYLLRETRLVPGRAGFPAIRARQSHYYALASAESYGWEWTARLGMADFSDQEQFDSGYKPFGGLGLRGYLYGDRLDDFGLMLAVRSDFYAPHRENDVPVGPA